MQYYTFELTEEAKDICTITTPFGNYRYERAPMGLRNTPAFAQVRAVNNLSKIWYNFENLKLKGNGLEDSFFYF